MYVHMNLTSAHKFSEVCTHINRYKHIYTHIFVCLQYIYTWLHFVAFRFYTSICLSCTPFLTHTRYIVVVLFCISSYASVRVCVCVCVQRSFPYFTFTSAERISFNAFALSRKFHLRRLFDGRQTLRCVVVGVYVCVRPHV